MSSSGMYITLPSNTVDRIGNNRTNNFRVDLPYQVSLDGGNWEMALAEIQFPKSWKNIAKPVEIGVRVASKHTAGVSLLLKGTVQAGHYSDLSALLGALRQAIREAMLERSWMEAQVRLRSFHLKVTKKEPETMKKYFNTLDNFWRNGDKFSRYVREHVLQIDSDNDENVVMSETLIKAIRTDADLTAAVVAEREKLDRKRTEQPLPTLPETPEEQELSYELIKDTRQLRMKLDGKTINEIILPSEVQYMLGLVDGKILKGSTLAKYSPDFTGGLTTLYVCCDIVEPQIVGNVHSELLRTVAVDSRKQFGETVSESYTAPHYLQVRRKQFDNVKIEIRSDTGELVPFEFGKVIIKIHLRKAKGI